MTRVAVVTGTGGSAFRLGADLGRLIALMSPSVLAAKRVWPPQWGRTRDSRAGTFSASDAVNLGGAAFDGYAITRRVDLARRTNLRIAWQTAGLGVRDLKARSTSHLGSHPDPTNHCSASG